MIRLPSKGIGHSATTHNNDLMVISDWVEASSLFRDVAIDKAKLSDLLVEENIYTDEFLCSARLEDIWSEISRRQSLLGRSSYLRVTDQSLYPSTQWDRRTAASLTLVLALSTKYDQWQKKFGKSSKDQGELFEHLCYASARQQLPDWDIIWTGWNSSNTSGLSRVVKQVAALFGDDVGDLAKHAPRKGKEAGVDMAGALTMPDGLPGPRMFAQCASGANWKTKTREPDLVRWGKYIDLITKPQRVIMVPFAVEHFDLIQLSPSVEGFIADRYRILGTSRHREAWVPADLRKRIAAWLAPRIAWLLDSDLSLDPI
jgi:hypothetical protein